MNGSMNVRLNPVLLTLGTLAGIVGGWGLYTMMTEIGQAPGVIGVISIAILELFAVGLGVHAVKVARDGDSPSRSMWRSRRSRCSRPWCS